MTIFILDYFKNLITLFKAESNQLNFASQKPLKLAMLKKAKLGKCHHLDPNQLLREYQQPKTRVELIVWKIPYIEAFQSREKLLINAYF